MARKIALEDDVVDQLCDQIFRELIIIMAEDPKTITRATPLDLDGAQPRLRC